MADILGMLLTDFAVWVQRIAVAVQAIDINTGSFKLSKEFISGVVAF